MYDLVLETVGELVFFQATTPRGKAWLEGVFCRPRMPAIKTVVREARAAGMRVLQ